MNTVRPAQRRRLKTSMVVLAGLVLLFIGLYQFAFVNPKFFAYAMGLRLPRLAVILIAGFAISAAAIVFQTIIRNTIVTPCLLGMNSLYLLIHTAVVFFLGSGSLFAVNPVYAFAADVIVMGFVAGFIYYTIFQKTGGNVLYVLLIGTVLSTFFSSMQNSLTRIMDPNEYDALLNTLTASFTNVNAACIIPGKRLCSVNPGMVLISLKTILPWGVRNRSTRAKPAQPRARYRTLAVCLTAWAVWGSTRAGTWMAEVFRVYFSVKSKNPPESSISSISPTSSSRVPMTAQPTSKPGMVSSKIT